MKKYFVFAALATLALASCSKSIDVVEEEDSPINFQAVTAKNSTKATTMVSGTTYPTDLTFGSAAFMLVSGSTTPAAYIPESEVKYNTTSSVWTTDTKYYWPKQSGNTLTFYSYSPWTTLNESATIDATNGVQFTKWDVDANQTVDVMVADVKTGATKTNCSDGVPTVFRHKLSQVVSFNVRTASNYAPGYEAKNAYQPGDKVFYITNISIKGINYIGNYKSGADINGAASTPVLGAWTACDAAGATASPATKDYVWYTSALASATTFADSYVAVASSKTSGTVSNDYLLILPQNFADTKLINVQYTIRTYFGTGASDYTDEAVSQDVKLSTIHAGDDSTDATNKDNTPNVKEDNIDSWLMNKKISYYLTISLEDDVIKWKPSVVDWENETEGDIVK